MKRPGLLALAFLVACEGTPPEVVGDFDGLWDFTAVRLTASYGTCHDTGTIIVHRQGDAFTGRWERAGACAGFGYVTADSITDGTIAGRTITFTIVTIPFGNVLCSDTAMLSAAPSDSLTGLGSCGAEQVSYTAVRERPLGAVAVTPAVAQRVIGIAATFLPVLRATNGDRVFGRSVAWTTDRQDIAGVTATGTVVALAPGSATITASAGSVTGSATFVAIATGGLTTVGAGNAKTCGLSVNGDAYCWGVMTGSFGNAPSLVLGGRRFVSLAMGHDHACGLTAAGLAYCWGDNAASQLGDGTGNDSPVPVAVGGGHSFAMLTAGEEHTCGVDLNGAGWCWGSSSDGQLGSGASGAGGPMAVAGGIVFASLSAGARHTCGRATNGSAWCWGNNVHGQLGDGTTTPRATPVPVSGALTFIKLAAGSRHSCGVIGGGAAYCWGEGGFGQLGNGSPAEQHAPVPVNGGLAFSTITAGSIYSCGVAAGGAAWCWGANGWGQLGTGAQLGTNVPAPVTGGLTFASISAGVYTYSDEAINEGTAAHTCGVTTGGIAWCWGVNLIGQLGNGVSGYYGATSVPVKVAGQP